MSEPHRSVQVSIAVEKTLEAVKCLDWYGEAVGGIVLAEAFVPGMGLNALGSLTGTYHLRINHHA